MPANVALQIHVEAFRPVGAMNTTITMSEQSPPHLRTVAELNGSYFIKVKHKPTGHRDDDDPNDMTITFELDTTEYRFVGISFAKRRAAAGDPNAFGQIDFPKVVIATSNNGTQQMAVTNKRSEKASFDYAILLQDLKTGTIGSIDPEIENEA